MVFDDGKEEGALRTIGEVSAALKIKPHVLRYWERQFPQLRPIKRQGGRRYYSSDDIALIRRIDRLLNRDGYTIKGARAALAAQGRADGRAKGNGTAGPAGVKGTSAAGIEGGHDASGSRQIDRDAILPRLRAIRERLAAALQADDQES